MIERVVNLGFETRVELLLADGEQLWAQMTREEADLLELADGQIVYATAATGEGVRGQRGAEDRGARLRRLSGRLHTEGWEERNAPTDVVPGLRNAP